MYERGVSRWLRLDLAFVSRYRFNRTAATTTSLWHYLAQLPMELLSICLMLLQPLGLHFDPPPHYELLPLWELFTPLGRCCEAKKNIVKQEMTTWNMEACARKMHPFQDVWLNQKHDRSLPGCAARWMSSPSCLIFAAFIIKRCERFSKGIVQWVGSAKQRRSCTRWWRHGARGS